MADLNLKQCQMLYDALSSWLLGYEEKMEDWLREGNLIASDIGQEAVDRIQILKLKLAKMQTGIYWRRALEQPLTAQQRAIALEFIALETSDLWDITMLPYDVQ